MRPYKFTTAAGLNLQKVGNGNTKFRGGAFVNTTDDPYYVKLYWSTLEAGPVVGTTVPDVTIGVPPLADEDNFGSGMTGFSLAEGLAARSGNLWIAATGAAADSDTTNTSSGQGVVTVFVDGP